MSRIYILGAGASAHAGAPLGDNIIKKYIELKLEQLERERERSLRRGIESSMDPILGNFSTLYNILRIQPNCKFTYDTSLEELLEENLPNIEDVFTFTYDTSLEELLEENLPNIEDVFTIV